MNLNFPNVSLPSFSLNNPLSRVGRTRAARGKSTKPIIDRRRATLFFEIKQRLPFETRAEMKLAAPDVADRLVDIHQASSNLGLRNLIEAFFDGADDQWAKRLKS